MYTTQTLFNTVAAHLLTQGKRASVVDWDGEELCRYRGQNGTKCAIGCLIPDELYKSRMEGFSISSLLYDDDFGLKTYFDGVDKRILSNLQLIHDTTSPNTWKEELAKVAVAYKLNDDVLKKF